MGSQVVATHTALQGEEGSRSRSAAAKPHNCPHATAAKVGLSSLLIVSLNILFREKVQEELELQAGQGFPHGR